MGAIVWHQIMKKTSILVVIHRTLDFGIGRTDTDTRKVSAEPIPIPIPKPIPQKVIFWTYLQICILLNGTKTQFINQK